MSDEFRIHVRVQRLKSFNELRALAHILDGSKAVVSDKAGVSTSRPQKQKWCTDSVGKSQKPNPTQRSSPERGWRLCGSHDHWQAACPKRKSESGNARTTGGTGGFRPVRK